MALLTSGSPIAVHGSQGEKVTYPKEPRLIKVGVMIMIDTAGKHGLMSLEKRAWESTAGVLDVRVTHWPTVPCAVDSDFSGAPKMTTAGAQGWMDSKSEPTSGRPSWWCAQRGHLGGVGQLLKDAPDAEYYLLLDHDSQVFPRAMARLMRQLRHSVEEHLYTGHLFHPSWTELSPEHSVYPLLVPFIASGGGVLLRGKTLQKLRDSGKLASFQGRQSSGDLKWAALDWTFGMAMASIGVSARGHSAFQQFVGVLPGLGPGSCDPACVVCHQYDQICDPAFVVGTSVDFHNTRRTWHQQLLRSDPSAAATAIATAAVEATLGPAARCAPSGHDVNVTAHEEAFQQLWKHTLDRARWSAPCAEGQFPAPQNGFGAGNRFVSQCGWESKGSEARVGLCGLHFIKK